jgi:hypothetical protein
VGRIGSPAVRLGLVGPKVSNARAPTDEPPMLGPRQAADTPAYKMTCCLIDMGKAHTPTNKALTCERKSVASEAADGDWQRANGRLISLHYEPPRVEVNK